MSGGIFCQWGYKGYQSQVASFYDKFGSDDRDSKDRDDVVQELMNAQPEVIIKFDEKDIKNVSISNLRDCFIQKAL